MTPFSSVHIEINGNITTDLRNQKSHFFMCLKGTIEIAFDKCLRSDTLNSTHILPPSKTKDKDQIW